MVDVAELRAQLSLLYAQFDKALRDIEGKSRKTGKVIEKELGTKPTSAMKGVGKGFEDALGAKPQKAIEDTRKHFSRLVWTSESGIKSISRVVTGILISQTFYRLVRKIQEATSEMWQFMVAMEQSYLALELLLGSVKGAEVMLRRLETFAALTPFEMPDVIAGTRRLMGFGFAASEVLPILEAVADACAIIGVSPAQLDQILMVFGKIRATGRMTAREIRSFGAAGIPIFQILQEQLGLTRDQIRNIGKEAAGQAGVVIPAILRGLEERFGGAAERLARTVGGLFSTLHDNLLLIAKDIFSGVYETFRGWLGRLIDRLNELREILVKYGVGGLFEAIIPARYQQAVRTMVAGLISIGRALKGIWDALQPVRAAFLEVFVRVLSIVIPTLYMLTSMIERLTRWIFQNDTTMRKWAISIFAAVSALSALLIVRTITSAIIKLAVAMGLTAATTGKWAVALTILITVITFLLLQIPKVKAWIERAFNSIAKFLGLDIESILQPLKAIDEAMPDEEAFHQVSEGMAGITEETKKADKELKRFLMAFDEVYAIPEKAEKMPEFEMPELEEFPLEEWWGKLGDIAELTLEDIGTEFEDFGSKVWDWLKDFFKAWWSGLKETFLAYVQLFKDLASAVGNFIRDTWRAFWQLFIDLGLAVGTFVQGIWRAFWQLFKDLGLAVKNFVLGIWGAFLQLFKDLGLAVKEFVLGFWGAFIQLFKDLGSAVVDFALGFWEAIKQLISDLCSAETFADVIAAFGTFFTTVWELTVQFGIDVGEAFSNFFTTVWELTVQFGIDVGEAFSDFFTRVKESTIQFGIDVKEAFSTFWATVLEVTVQFGEDVKKAFSDFWNRILEAVTTFGERLKEAVRTAYMRVLTAIDTYYSAMLGGLWDKLKQIGANIRPFLIGLGDTVRETFRGILINIKNFIIGIINAVIGAINTLIRLINRIPGVSIRTIPTIPAQEKAPGMQYGGILRKEQLVKAAEGGRPEAYTPLTAEALKPWAESIATALAAKAPAAEAPTPVYVGVLIADERGIRELERRMQIVRKEEVARRGGG